MAGVITHMVIAKEMLPYLPEGAIQDLSLFYLGTLAPDAIHAREGYIREYKKHTHFRDDIPDSDFELPENYSLYQNRLLKFIQDNRNRADGLIDLYRGYVVHILTDELFVLSIRKEFCETMAKMRISQNDRSFFDYIVGDMNRNDMFLVDHYNGMNELKHYMEIAPIYPIDDYISANEMRDCRNWLIHQHFIKQPKLPDPEFISHERMSQFIKTAAVTIAKLMSDDGSPYQMF